MVVQEQSTSWDLTHRKVRPGEGRGSQNPALMAAWGFAQIFWLKRNLLTKKVVANPLAECVYYQPIEFAQLRTKPACNQLVTCITCAELLRSRNSSYNDLFSKEIPLNIADEPCICPASGCLTGTTFGRLAWPTKAPTFSPLSAFT